MDPKLAADIDVVREFSKQRRYDFIVVGSGLAGGLIAQQLAQKQKSVLLLEKGGATFSTHCLNTSRPHWQIGGVQGPSQDNDIVYDIVKQKIETAAGSDPYAGGPVYTLGGRSTVWGLYSPKIDVTTSQEYFPSRIHNYINMEGYAKAFEIFTNKSQEYTNPYPTGSDISTQEVKEAKEKLEAAIKSVYVGSPNATLSPLAVQFSPKHPYQFPQGAYSTVDYILDKVYARDPNLTVLLNTEVISISYDQIGMGSYKACSLIARTAPGGLQTELFAKQGIILCAGTLGTAKICLNSGLQEIHKNIGKGLTDHEIWGVRFVQKKKDELKDPIKLQCQIDICNTPALLNVVINADHFLGRNSTAFQWPTQRIGEDKDKAIDPSECDTINVTIEFAADLFDESEIINSASSEPVIRVKRKLDHQRKECQEEIQKLAASIRDMFLGQTKEPAPRLSLAGFGVVAHEVGTMRLQGPQTSDHYVVDENYRVNKFGNLYVLDLSIFPVSPPANPSLTLAAMALQLVNSLAK
jgi:choline dehydrogenase-like flavoprotein